MNILDTCPVCSGKLSKNDNACPRCGFRLIGATQKFAVVGSEQTAVENKDLLKDPYLEVIKGADMNLKFYLDAEVLSVGRDPKCDIFLNERTISRKHAELYVKDGTVTVHDCKSLNGVWVNGSVIEKDTLLQKNSILQIGSYVMKLLDSFDEE
jgi:pSer/pThr/pTyr-binding forkhead associated (FHA) protein